MTLTVFLDTNIILEGRPLEDLPWSELDKVGPILAFIVPTVLKEVDGKKRDGRLGEKARAFNRLIAPAATRGEILTIREAGPRVELAVARCSRIDWDAPPLDSMDKAEPDARVVAEVLAATNVMSDQKILISQDINPLSMAFAAGLKTHHISSDWLASKEPSPAEKEVSRLKQKIKILEAAEPKLEIEIEASRGPIIVRSVAALTKAERDFIFRRILASVPKIRHDPWIFNMDHLYEARIEKFKTKTIPRFLEDFSENLSRTYAQIPFSVRVLNAGVVRADRLIVQISSSGGTINDRYLLTTANGPTPPEPRNGLPVMPVFHRPAALIGKHEIHMEVEPKLGGFLVEMHCEDFRQGRDWRFKGVLTLDHNDPAPASLRVNASASNLHGDVVQETSIEKAIVPVAMSELIDLQSGERMVEFPMKAVLDAAIQKRDFSDFVVAGSDSDD